MNNFTKIMLSGLLLLLATSLGIGVYKAAWGNYFANASFITSGLLVLGFIMAVYVLLGSIRYIWRSAPVLAFIILQGCSYAKSNQQVVTSTDCGMNWKKVTAGDAVPTGTGNPCFMKVVMPNFPMQGDSRFVSNLKDRVRASIHIDYDYSITEPLSFIRQAKFLGKANANADSGEALDPAAFEGAENMVIDKRIRDVSKSLFLKEDIVELDQAELESNLLAESNKILEPLGVHLNFITLTFDLDEQTRQAIDISTAMKIYESKGISDVGKQVMVSKAGATKVSVENKLNPQQTQEEE